MDNQVNKLIKYNEGEIEVSISIKEDTIWLTQKQIAELFDVTKQNISLHIIEIFKSKELEKTSTTKKYLTVQKEGNREVSRELDHYNLDVIISVGYKINSIKATKFRQWATSVLKDYISNGYAINTHKITEQRLLNLETDMQEVKSHIQNNTLDVKQGIFYNGQIYDAYAFINDIFKLAKKDVTLIDNYIDDTIFTLCSKYPHINFIIYTQTINKQLSQDFQKYKKQYRNIELKSNKNFHDRFLLIDNIEIYHIGASLKDLGNKIFAFSKMDIKSFEMVEKLK